MPALVQALARLASSFGSSREVTGPKGVLNTICNLLERREVGGDRAGKSAVSRLYISQSDTEGYGNRVAAKWGHLCHDLFRRQNFPPNPSD